MKLPINAEIGESFLKPEVRDGYPVSSKLKKIWAIELDLFLELSRICKKYNIHFHVCGGTLIGAVRHKGFIPWDDDFDIWMTRENLNKLIAVSGEFRQPYFLQTPLNDRRYACPISRFRNSKTTGAITGLDTPDYNNGIYIDIYALDGMSMSPFKCMVQYILKRIVVRMWALRGQMCPRDKTVCERVVFLFKPITFVLSYKKWYELYVAILSMWTHSAERIAHIVTSNRYGKKNWITLDELNDTISVPFENVRVPIPRNYDVILRREFGDYTKFPPVEERGKWHEGIIHFEPDIPYTEYLKSTR